MQFLVQVVGGGKLLSRPLKSLCWGVLPMELGEIDEASGDLVQHFDSLEFVAVFKQISVSWTIMGLTLRGILKMSCLHRRKL